MNVEFSTTRDRDAGHVIRGFVYQIALTIRDWLQLSPHESLELERGEDIDIICRELSTLAAESRVLQQVKYSGRPITLRSANAAAFLACACEHRVQNEQLILHFRFISNAPIGLERRSPLRDGKRGIEVWKSLKCETLPADQLPLLAALRSLLVAVPKPAELNQTTWDAYTTFLSTASDSALHTFIRSVSWSMGESNIEEITDTILDSIQTKFGRSQDQSRSTYHQLFVRVCTVLSKDGIKRLGHGDLVAELSAVHSLNPAIAQLLDTLARRVEGIERRVEAHDALLRDIGSTLNLEGSTSSARFATTDALSLDPPSPVECVVKRSQVVGGMLQELGARTWLALDGEWGAGKRHLAILLADALGHCIAWVRLEDESQPVARINWALSALQVAGGDGGVVVVEDLPALRGDDAVSDRLLVLASECRRVHARLITTSLKPLPTELKSRNSDVLARSAPPLSAQEVSEFLAARKAPQGTEKLSSFLQGLTRGNAALLSAVIEYIALNGWMVSNETLQGLFTGEHATGIRERTYKVLTDTVPNAESRNLLYRLTLCTLPFTESEVNLLCQASPPIAHPQEHLASLVGICISRKGSEFQLSRLAKELGSKNLAQETLQSCHSALARHMISNGLNQCTAGLAVAHLIGAHEINAAGVLYLHVLSALKHEPKELDDWGLSTLWWNNPLPQGMQLNTRLLIRGLQVYMGLRRNQDVTPIISDLKLLIALTTKGESLEALGACMFAGPLSELADSTRTREFTQLALGLPEPAARRKVFAKFRRALVQSQWGLVYKSGNALERSKWLQDVERFNSAELQQLFEASQALEDCLSLADKVYLDQADKKIGTDEALAELDRMESAGRKLSPMLVAAAVRSKLKVLCDENRVEEALNVAQKACANATDLELLVVQEAMGSQLVYKKQLDNAATWLEAATANPCQLTELKITALIMLAVTKSDQSPDKAVQLTYEALRLARGARSDLLVKTADEHAIALWKANRVPDAYDPLVESSRVLLDSSRRRKTWKALFAIHGHLTGFLSGVASGRPPEKIAGDAAYAAPRQGMLLQFRLEAEQFFSEEKVPLLSAQLAMYAEAIHLDDEAGLWALDALNRARARGDSYHQRLVSLGAIEAMAASGDFAECVQLAYEAATAMALYKGPPEKTNIDLSILGPKSAPSWKDLEYNCRRLLFIPGVLRIFHLALRDPQKAEGLTKVFLDSLRTLRAESEHKEDWTLFIDIIHSCTLDRPDWKSLSLRGNEMAARDSLIQVIAFLGATLDREIPPEQAVVAQHVALSLISRTCTPQSTAWRQVVVPFYTTYWEDTFARKRFLFRAPGGFEAQLKAALLEPAEERPQRILNLIAGNLGRKLGPAQSPT